MFNQQNDRLSSKQIIMEQTFLDKVNAEQSLTKTRAGELAQLIVDVNNDGQIDTLTALARLEFLSQIIEIAKSNLRESAIDELHLYGAEAKTGVKKFGVTFKHKETAVKYDFSQTAKWNELKAIEDAAAERRKTLETTLKNLDKMVVFVDSDTGEMTELLPPVKTSKTTVEITLGK